jgi:hypothetical protein
MTTRNATWTALTAVAAAVMLLLCSCPAKGQNPPPQAAAPPVTAAPPAAPAAQTSPAPERKVALVPAGTVLASGAIKLGMPVSELRASFAANKPSAVKENWAVQDAVGMVSAQLLAPGKTDPQDPAALINCSYQFVDGKLVNYSSYQVQQDETSFKAWVEQAGAGLPAPGDGLPEFAKGSAACTLFENPTPEMRVALWASEEGQSVLGAVLSLNNDLSITLTDVPGSKRFAEEYKPAPGSKSEPPHRQAK